MCLKLSPGHLTSRASYYFTAWRTGVLAPLLSSGQETREWARGCRVTGSRGRLLFPVCVSVSSFGVQACGARGDLGAGPGEGQRERSGMVRCPGVASLGHQRLLCFSVSWVPVPLCL